MSEGAAAERAVRSLGTSEQAIYDMVVRNLDRHRACGGTLLDVGCGTGNLWRLLKGRFARYVGVDVVRYSAFPAEGEFYEANLDAGPLPVPDEFADVVVAVETIEHLENPRKFVRELVRVVRRGGWVVLTTPNQLSLLSLATLVVKGRFNAFQDVHYPTHISALLEVDLRRMAGDCGLSEVTCDFSLQGRVPLSGLHYPRWLTRMFPRALSDNILLVGRR